MFNIKVNKIWEFPGSPVVRSPCFCCQEHGFRAKNMGSVPDLRTKIPQAMQHIPYPKKKNLSISKIQCTFLRDREVLTIR